MSQPSPSTEHEIRRRKRRFRKKPLGRRLKFWRSMSAHVVFVGCVVLSLGAIVLVALEHLHLGEVGPYSGLTSILAGLIVFAFIRIDDGKGFARSRSISRAPDARKHFFLWESILLGILLAVNILLGIFFLLI